jgi:hypothetical protein
VPEVAASTPHQSDDVAEAEQAVYSSSRLTDSMSDRDNSSDLDTIRNQKSTQEIFSTFELTNDGLSGLSKVSHVFKEGQRILGRRILQLPDVRRVCGQSSRKEQTTSVKMEQLRYSRGVRAS